MLRPYIGVTGFTMHTEVEFVRANLLEENGRPLMVGVLASSKTLRGIQNRYPNRYPPVERIAEIFTGDSSVINLIHFNTKEPSSLFYDLCVLTEFAGPHFHGFQLNIPWPDPKVLRAYRDRYPFAVIVLQVGNEACLQEERSASRIARRVGGYEECIEGVLLDLSGGRGVMLAPGDVEFVGACFSEISKRFRDLVLGAAGGLSAETMHVITPLLPYAPRLAIDAQGMLRDARDHLDLFATREYLRAAGEFLPSIGSRR